MSQPPGSIAQCGTEPTYYTTNQFGRFESLTHSSWKNCVADWSRNYQAPLKPTVQDWVPTFTPAPTPPPPPIADSAQVWVSQHNDLMIAAGAAAVLILVVLFLILSTRRVNRKTNHQ